jgi:hypothetical protein
MTTATAALDPGPLITGPGAGATADDTSTRVDFGRWEREFAADDGCSHPIQLRSRTDMIDLATGELAPRYGTVTTACGNRREAVCPACSAVYKRDARQLVKAGLAGGKGIPETIAAHPCVFATLTAPSFGPVHARRMRGKTVLPCRPRRDAKARRCPHGRDVSCPTRHGETDPRLGQPMCPDCYDYESAVLFNAYATKLWGRFVTYLPRHLARLAGVTQKALRAQLRIRFVKVAEYQARGVVHFHAVIRLDAAAEDYQPPAASYTAALLCDAIDQAAAAVRIVIDHDGQASRSASARRPTAGSSGTAPTCPARARRSTDRPWPTTSPSTPPRPSTVTACPARGYAARPTSATCAARPTTGG